MPTVWSFPEDICWLLDRVSYLSTIHILDHSLSILVSFNKTSPNTAKCPLGGCQNPSQFRTKVVSDRNTNPIVFTNLYRWFRLLKVKKRGRRQGKEKEKTQLYPCEIFKIPFLILKLPTHKIYNGIKNTIHVDCKLCRDYKGTFGSQDISLPLSSPINVI